MLSAMTLDQLGAKMRCDKCASARSWHNRLPGRPARARSRPSPRKKLAGPFTTFKPLDSPKLSSRPQTPVVCRTGRHRALASPRLRQSRPGADHGTTATVLSEAQGPAVGGEALEKIETIIKLAVSDGEYISRHANEYGPSEVFDLREGATSRAGGAGFGRRVGFFREPFHLKSIQAAVRSDDETGMLGREHTRRLVGTGRCRAHTRSGRQCLSNHHQGGTNGTGSFNFHQ
jgi:hypothetical protein